MKQPVIKTSSIAEIFGVSMARLLADNIMSVHPEFPGKKFIASIQKHIPGTSYSERLVIFADAIDQYMNMPYPQAVAILLAILGPENPSETGMFKQYSWVMPISKYIELYGQDHPTVSLRAISEITKRCTGEFAVRVFIRKYPALSLRSIERWACSRNFHLRRLASEGLRPKLPWATKLDIYNDNPEPVFQILRKLCQDEVMFVKRSVANHIRDWVKVNPPAASGLIRELKKIDNPHTKWIIKHALRKGLGQ